MKALLVYDASCGPCVRFKRALDWLDVFERLEFVPLMQAEQEGILAKLPPPLRFRSFHLVSPGGKVLSAARALPELILLLPAGGLISRFIAKTPFGPGALEVLYSTFSRLHSTRACSPRRG